jgi:hypothetical protein
VTETPGNENELVFFSPAIPDPANEVKSSRSSELFTVIVGVA